tara:strand:+ start:2319 stop:2441 length:123 start_codon:yes stop_codon:yes gene_type:complete
MFIFINDFNIIIRHPELDSGSHAIAPIHIIVGCDAETSSA